MQENKRTSDNGPTDAERQRAADLARAKVHQAYNQPGDPYNRTQQPIFDWSQYHSAWQEYYQEYYQRYYAQQQGPAPTTQEPQEEPSQRKRVKQLKSDIVKTVKEKGKKARRSHLFVPVVSAIAIGLVFLFLQFNGVMIAQIKTYVSPGALNFDAISIDPSTPVNVGPEYKLIIPKINVEVPVDYSSNTLDESTIQVSLRDGAVYYPLPGANARPGERGNTVILGHSSNDIFNQGAYKFIFVLLDKLENGDVFYVHYQGKRYIYRVSEKRVINPKDIGALQIGYDKAVATLITCTPPGTDFQRLLIYADQISPDPSNASTATQTTTEKPETIAGNEPSFMDNLWKSLFGR